MSAPSFVLGTDGGGTHTRCAAIALDGRLLGVGEAGPSNYLRVGLEEAVGNVLLATEQATAAAGLSLPATAACVCLAGLGRDDNLAMMRPHLRRLAGEVHLDTDARAALAGAHALGPGLVVIAGTGAIAFGQDGAGRLVRADGWGSLLGDEGGGFWIGQEALRAVVRAADGRGDRTALSEAVLAALGIANVPELVSRLPSDRLDVPGIAGLAAVCSRVAEAGDPVACDILRRAGMALARTCLAALSNLDLGPAPGIALTGSVFADTIVRETFTKQLLGLLPSAHLSAPRFPPVLGAGLLALRAAGVQVSAALLATLQASAEQAAASCALR